MRNRCVSKAWRASAGALASLCLLVGAESVGAAPAQAARGHVPRGMFGSAGSGPGQLLEPAGVAVDEATGDVFVVDKGNNRVEYFNAAGVFQGEFNGPSAEGVGALKEGSTLIEPAVAVAGAFSVGEEVEAVGLEPETTIVAIPAPGVLEVSKAATSAVTAEPQPELLSAHQSFAGPEGIAVDNSCVSRKLPEPKCLEEDPSDGDVYVVDPGHQAVDKFSATGAYITQLSGFTNGADEGSIDGVAVNPRGTLSVAAGRPPETLPGGETVGPRVLVFHFNNAAVNEPLPPPTETVSQDCPILPGFALDSEGSFYIHEECVGIVKEGVKGELLNRAFYPEGSDWLATELVSNDVYVDTGVAVNRVGPAGLVEGAPIESLALADRAGSGVAVSSATETLYVAESVAGDVEVFAPEPAGPPTVEKESASKVTGESATLEAAINVRGASTSYEFEYGPCATLTTCKSSPYGSTEPTPEASAGEAFEVVSVPPVNVEGLSANTVYHYRLVAHNEHGPVAGAEKTFTTQTTAPFALPDGREWELVSPPDKRGAGIESIGDEVTIQASAAGSAIAYAADAPTESEPQGYSGPVQVLSTRSSTGWVSRDLTVPHESGTHTSVGKGAQYRLFSEDLSHTVVQPFGAFVACHSPQDAAQPCLSPAASEQTAFLQTDFLNGDPLQACEPPMMSCFQPLVTGAAGFSNVPPGTQFGEASKCAPPVPEVPICGPEFLAATPDLKHVVLQSGAALTSPPSGGLYEFSQEQPAAQQLAPISLLPESEGGGPAIGYVGYHNENTRNAISDDGSLVFFQTETGAGGGEEGPLYVRHIVSGVTGQTLRLTPTKGIFQDASSDGSRVFYTEAGTLFECRILTGAGEKLECEGESEHIRTELGTGVEGLIAGASEDGSWVYFVATSPLATGAVSGQPNLYVRHGATTSLVAVLSDADFPDWSGADVGNLELLTARVSPNGEWLAFMSQRELTGYDNRDALSGKPDEEVFLYHAPQDLATEAGSLTCASCNPSGARPVGEEGAQASPSHGGFVVRGAWEGSTWLAAEVPEWTPYRLKGAVYQSRFLSNSGRLFFNAIDPLVTHAVNGTWDVYEFEPLGVGSCSVESAAFSERSGGCVGLISGGSATRESAFLDASENGNDVFFLTAAKLVPQDTDEAFDVYDAHVCTAAEPCFPPKVSQPPACEAEAYCRPAPTPQPEVFGAPSTATFSGPGNPPPPPPPAVVKKKTVKCKKNFVRKRVRKKEECVKKPKKAKKTSRRGK
jgi:NHL repeat/WD40-like Beta Propeller Repeat